MALDLVGRRVAVTSPQGRFADGAALLDGRDVVASRAHGKHLFLGFTDAVGSEADAAAAPVDGGAHSTASADDDAHWTDGAERWLRVHLGLYGAWDLHGAVTPLDDADAVRSLGAPRRALRMGERETPLDGGAADVVGVGVGGPASAARAADAPPPAAAPDFPPEPVGQVRVRLATDVVVADLRGPSACEVLTPAEVRAVVEAAGPDPAVDAGPAARDEFVRRVTRRRVAVGRLLMDQSVVSGIGNIYRAELLFRARLHPETPGTRLTDDDARALWEDWTVLLADGIRTGAMVTRGDLDDAGRARALRDRGQRHAVYGRAGLPCLRCGTPVALADMAGRKLYWCPGCQTRADGGRTRG